MNEYSDDLIEKDDEFTFALLSSAPDQALSISCARCGGVPHRFGYRQHLSKDALVVSASCHGEETRQVISCLELLASPNISLFISKD